MIDNERDPSGLSAHEAGAKLDNGKVRMGLMVNGFARSLREVAKVATFGAGKYTDNGWVEVDDGINRYTDALHRHLNEEAMGALYDDDSELLHAAHAAWNALARLDLMLRENHSLKSGQFVPPESPVERTIRQAEIAAQFDMECG